jgi:SRSO17 transposase
MDLRGTEGSEERFSGYVEELRSVIGHADRAGPLRDYCVGLMMPCERKSVEPMAAVTAPERTAAQHQSLLHFVGQAPWSDEAVLAKVRELVLPKLERREPIEAWIIDDTSFPKQGRHSVGVAHQYCGQLGKQENCQVAVSLSLANHQASLPVAWRLFLPQAWIEDSERRRKTGVPEGIVFKSKPEIALEQVRRACEAGLPRGVVLMDAGYGHDAKLRLGIRALGLSYVANVLPNVLLWIPGQAPLPGAPKRRRHGKTQLVSAKELALALPTTAWRKVTWREGTAELLSSRFARIRVQVAHRHRSTGGWAEEWLLVEWPVGEAEPTKYWLSTLPKEIAFKRLVDFAKMRWRIERDYQELKQELGLGHFEGRGWRGFHHHATLCIAAYGFLISERETIPPSEPRPTTLFAAPVIPESYKPRGAAAAYPTPHPKLDCHDATAADHRTRERTRPMSMLRPADQPKTPPTSMTQYD